MDGFQERRLDIDGTDTRILVGGKAGAPAALFLHGGIPGVTPYCGGAHIWGDCPAAFRDRAVIVPDLPGSGGTVQDSQPLTMDRLGQHVMAMLSALSLDWSMSSATISAA